MLFKPPYLAKFLEGFSTSVLQHARNTAKGVLLISGVIENRFYESSISDCINAVKTNFEQNDFKQNLAEFHSDAYVRNTSSSERFDRLTATCFDYYFSRLPILLRMNRVIWNGKKRCLSSDEIELVERGCFAVWGDQFPEQLMEYDFSGDHRVSLLLTKWWAKTSKRDDHVYDSNWLFTSLESLYPTCVNDTNIGILTIYALESCFPMFWDHLQGRYRQSLTSYGSLGWFLGARDTDEFDSVAARNSPDTKARSHPTAN